jgi:hypothetical protein
VVGASFAILAVGLGVGLTVGIHGPTYGRVDFTPMP